MKTLKIIITAFFAILISISAFAQTSSKTETFKVAGNCGSCKARIEKAAKINGVDKADWNSNTKMLTLVYNPAKVKTDDVLKNIAAVGHDTDKFKADAKVYNKLPGCCQYERMK